MFVYSIPPIDSWAGWMSEQEYIASLKAHTYEHDAHWTRWQESFKNLAFKIAKEKASWEGDFAQGPYWSGIPAEGGNSHCSVLLGWKQRNNGTTYIASEYRLSWLEKDWPAVRG